MDNENGTMYVVMGPNEDRHILQLETCTQSPSARYISWLECLPSSLNSLFLLIA